MNTFPGQPVRLGLDPKLRITEVEAADRADRAIEGTLLPDLIATWDRAAIDGVLRALQARRALDRLAEVRLPSGHRLMRLQLRPSPHWHAVLEPIIPGDMIYEMLEKTEHYDSALGAMASGVAALDQRGRILRHNGRFYELMQLRSPHGVRYNEDGLLGRYLEVLCRHSEGLEELADLLDRQGELQNKTSLRLERGGETLEFHLVPSVMRTFGTVGLSVVVRDVTAEVRLKTVLTQLEEANRRLAEEATRDPLTGLLNRRGCEAALASNTELARRVGMSTAALLIDVDDFKAVNSRYGHAGADAILRDIARSLQRIVRSTDIAARIGGDEFLVVLPGTDRQGALTAGEKICAHVAGETSEGRGVRVGATVSIGVTTIDHDDASIEAILRGARRGLERSKEMGKGRVSAGS